MTIQPVFEQDQSQALRVYSAADFTALDGANFGDPLTASGDLIEGDVYQLRASASSGKLRVLRTANGLEIAPKSELGRPGAVLHLDCCATFMAPDGTVVEMLLLVEMCTQGRTIAAVHVHPLIELAPRVDYALVAVDPDSAMVRFAEASCVSFVGDTRITMASGAQVAVKDLKVGDRVLTRDHGVQPVRWIGSRTERAAGAFAPIRIAAGTLNNDGDLVVSPNHCLFVYQRQDRLGAGRAEILVKAQYLLNDETVTRTSGGFVDYYQISFDQHEIIYAEGIAVETLLADDSMRPALVAELPSRPADMARRGLEVAEGALDSRHAATLLRQASVG
ncbi:Hint domain-containing protein [Palleronia sp. THAF1]|uniref:Hint domain-containing protein n=1 Tax=Palleronia sp. THAF1 TaxID=2587842 RepID=UPI000F51B21E|nr:Hint domain-containing protein [Palleronia sp. THAF1]